MYVPGESGMVDDVGKHFLDFPDFRGMEKNADQRTDDGQEDDQQFQPSADAFRRVRIGKRVFLLRLSGCRKHLSGSARSGSAGFFRPDVCVVVLVHDVFLHRMAACRADGASGISRPVPQYSRKVRGCDGICPARSSIPVSRARIWPSARGRIPVSCNPIR